METTTYSFTDLVGSIIHPEFGIYMFDGAGTGSVIISKTTDRTAHDIASDGSVMVSKIAGNNGTVTIEAQQSSKLHKWLLAWANALALADTSAWAETSITLRNAATKTSHVCMGVSPLKEADTPYQAQGQRVSWTLMCAEIINMPL